MRGAIVALCAAAAASACATGGNGGNSFPSSTTGNSLGNPSGSSASSGSTQPSMLGGGGPSGDLGGGAPSDASTAGEGCQHLGVSFVPKIPLVYVLVDGSGSMFTATGSTPAAWGPLRSAALNVIMNLQTQVDFGWGEFASDGTAKTYDAAGYAGAKCGLVNQVPMALGNYSAISAEYTSIDMPEGNEPGGSGKTNTPAFLALGQAGDILQAQAAQADAGSGAPGGKYILFVTDGETDFCDDGNTLCPIDAVTAEIQKLYSAGIQTLVLGLPSGESQLSALALQDFANAGAGVVPALPPTNPGQAPNPAEFMQECNSGGWAAFYKSMGATGSSIATYADVDAAVSNAPLYSPTGTDETALTTAISAALATVKSCSFDLQGQIEVNLSAAGEGRVTIDGTSVPYVGDAGSDGWMMATSTQLDLVGSACDTWRTTGKNIAFDFPCDVIMPLPR